MKKFGAVKSRNTNKKRTLFSRNLLKAYVKSQPSSSSAEITTAVREMFRDVVRTAAEADIKIPRDRDGIFEPGSSRIHLEHRRYGGEDSAPLFLRHESAGGRPPSN